jgi:hypothetical protein
VSFFSPYGSVARPIPPTRNVWPRRRFPSSSAEDVNTGTREVDCKKTVVVETRL